MPARRWRPPRIPTSSSRCDPLSIRVEALGRLPEVRPGDDLAALIDDAAPEIAADDVVVIAHKVVSKAEGRTRALASIEPSERALELARAQDKDARLVQAVLDESSAVIKAERGVLVCETRHGFVCANAGVDASNSGEAGEIILLPLDPDASARALRARLEELRGLRPAIVVADSFGRAWRVGQTDIAVGVAGLLPLDDWRGRRDSTGRDLRATAIAVADSVAGAADLARSKDSREPVVRLSGLGRFVTDEDGPGAAALLRERSQDLFR